MATFSAVILKGDVHIKQNGTTNIKIRITQNRKLEYISTDLFVNPNNFEKGWASGKSGPFINGRIKDILDNYNEIYLRMGDIRHKLSAKELKERLLGGTGDTEIDFIVFAKDLIKELEKKGKSGTVRGFNSLIANLEKFRPKLTFQEINPSFLESFRNYLVKNGVKNAVNNYLRYLRQIFNKGRERLNDEDRGIIRIPNYPFKRFKIEQPVFKTKENALTVEQLKLFINYKPTRERAQMSKDIFLLMFYLIGINSKDLFHLGKPEKGRVNYTRFKTGKEYSIKLEPEALDIVSKYDGENILINMSERYSDYIDFRKYVNKDLKDIGSEISKELKEKDPHASFPSNISTNWARHTWATIARNDCKINKDDVALCLGHEDTDNRVTDIYIRYDYSIVDESNRKVLDTLLGKEPAPTELPKRGRKKNPKA